MAVRLLAGRFTHVIHEYQLIMQTIMEIQVRDIALKPDLSAAIVAVLIVLFSNDENTFSTGECSCSGAMSMQIV